ncbi:TPA: hypothetical protein QFL96_002113 [Enterococcus faecium]
MAREEALKIGKVIADNWWANSRPIILSKQHIEKQKAWQQIKSDSADQSNESQRKYI